jgi:hypothetical protein
VTGWAKANWDVALERKLGRVGLGVVVHDSQGNLLVAKCAVQNGCLALAV